MSYAGSYSYSYAGSYSYPSEVAPTAARASTMGTTWTSMAI